MDIVETVCLCSNPTLSIGLNRRSASHCPTRQTSNNAPILRFFFWFCLIVEKKKINIYNENEKKKKTFFLSNFKFQKK